MRAPNGGGGGGGGAAKNCTHNCNNFQGVIVAPNSVMFSPPILPETLHLLCNRGFRVEMFEVNNCLKSFYWVTLTGANGEGLGLPRKPKN